MIRLEDINEILHYVASAMHSLGCDDENKIGELTYEVERQIRLSLPLDEKRMRKYVEEAYNSASFIYNTGRSFLFYQKHDRQPIELKFGFNREYLYFLKQIKLKYVTEEEFDIIRERIKTDSSKRLCDTLCNGFWKSEKNADRFHVPVSFHGENPDYCDKSSCDCL